MAVVDLARAKVAEAAAIVRISAGECTQGPASPNVYYLRYVEAEGDEGLQVFRGPLYASAEVLAEVHNLDIRQREALKRHLAAASSVGSVVIVRYEIKERSFDFVLGLA
jgi:hypothetical protein